MKKGWIRLLCTLMMVCALALLCACGGSKEKKEEVKVDFASVHDVIAAYNDGQTVNGKTVKVTALMVPTAGMIATIPGRDFNGSIFVYLNSDSGDKTNVTGIREGTQVALRIESVENLLERGYFIYGIAEAKIQ